MWLTKVWLSNAAAIGLATLVTTLLGMVVGAAVYVSKTREKTEQLESKVDDLENDMRDIQVTQAVLENRVLADPVIREKIKQAPGSEEDET